MTISQDVEERDISPIFSVDSMSGFKDDRKIRVYFCLSCNAEIPDKCQCIWAAVRKSQADTLSIKSHLEGLDEKISDHELEKRVKDIEYRLKHIIELPSEIDIRLQDVERIIDNIPDNYTRRDKDLEERVACHYIEVVKRLDGIENGDPFDYDERIDDLENIETEKRLHKLEIANLGKIMAPQLWVDLGERIDKFDSRLSLLELELKAKEFKGDMDNGERWMECLNGLELKMENKNSEIIKCFVTADGNIENEIDQIKDALLKEIAHFEARFRELERFRDITHLEYKAKRKPHKCPVCDSQGWLLSSYLTDAEKVDCHSCEGKGIVWG